MMKTNKIIAIILAALMMTAVMSVGVSAAGSANLVDIDKTTRGDWVGVYGSEGYIIITDDESLQSIPSYAKLDYINEFDDIPSFWAWYDPENGDDAQGDPDDDVAATRIPSALFKDAGKNFRIAACYYSGEFFTVTVDIGSETKLVTLYTTDYDEGSREADVTVFDDGGKQIIAPMELYEYEGGWYLKYKMSGKVDFTFEKTAGPNAVISGIFFDPDPDAVAVVAEEPAAVAEEAAPVEVVEAAPAPVVTAPAPAPKSGDATILILLSLAAAALTITVISKSITKKNKI